MKPTRDARTVSGEREATHVGDGTRGHLAERLRKPAPCVDRGRPASIKVAGSQRAILRLGVRGRTAGEEEPNSAGWVLMRAGVPAAGRADNETHSAELALPAQWFVMRAEVCRLGSALGRGRKRTRSTRPPAICDFFAHPAACVIAHLLTEQQLVSAASRSCKARQSRETQGAVRCHRSANEIEARYTHARHPSQRAARSCPGRHGASVLARPPAHEAQPHALRRRPRPPQPPARLPDRSCAQRRAHGASRDLKPGKCPVAPSVRGR
jgi:hypothetical protein